MDEEKMIPIDFMIITGDQNTPPEYRISHAQVNYITPKQWERLTMRLNDLIFTLNSLTEENKKEEPNNG